MPEASGYDMHLYCRNGCDGGEPWQYYRQTRAECVRLARDDGWIFNADGEVTCPRCSGKKPKKKAMVKKKFLQVASGKIIEKEVEEE